LSLGETSFETLVNFREWFNGDSKEGFEGEHSVFEKKRGNLRSYFDEIVFTFLIWPFRKKIKLRSNFPEMEVEMAYKEPEVNSSTEEITWGDINLGEVL
jgi:hypothetical protein